jgi:hypothetical protein
MNPNDLSFFKAKVARVCAWEHSATVYPLTTLLRVRCAQALARNLLR